MAQHCGCCGQLGYKSPSCGKAHDCLAGRCGSKSIRVVHYTSSAGQQLAEEKLAKAQAELHDLSLQNEHYAGALTATKAAAAEAQKKADDLAVALASSKQVSAVQRAELAAATKAASAAAAKLKEATARADSAEKALTRQMNDMQLAMEAERARHDKANSKLLDQNERLLEKLALRDAKIVALTTPEKAPPSYQQSSPVVNINFNSNRCAPNTPSAAAGAGADATSLHASPNPNPKLDRSTPVDNFNWMTGIDSLAAGFDTVKAVPTPYPLFQFDPATSACRTAKSSAGVYPSKFVALSEHHHSADSTMKFDTAEEYESYVATTFGLKAEAGLFAAGVEGERIAKLRGDKAQQLFRAHSKVILYQLTTIAPVEDLRKSFHPLFARAIAQLPIEFNATTQAKYFEFFEMYGTHYVSGVEVGGERHCVGFANRKAAAGSNEGDCRARVEANLFGKASVGIGADRGSGDVKSTTSEMAVENTKIAGGDLGANDKKAWKDSIVAAPVSFVSQLKPFSALLADGFDGRPFGVAVTAFLHQHHARSASVAAATPAASKRVLCQIVVRGSGKALRGAGLTSNVDLGKPNLHDVSTHWYWDSAVGTIESVAFPGKFVSVFDVKLSRDVLKLKAAADPSSPLDQLAQQFTLGDGKDMSKYVATVGTSTPASERRDFSLTSKSKRDRCIDEHWFDGLWMFPHHYGLNQQWEIKPLALTTVATPAPPTPSTPLRVGASAGAAAAQSP